MPNLRLSKQGQVVIMWATYSKNLNWPHKTFDWAASGPRVGRSCFRQTNTNEICKNMQRFYQCALDKCGRLDKSWMGRGLPMPVIYFNGWYTPEVTQIISIARLRSVSRQWNGKDFNRLIL